MHVNQRRAPFYNRAPWNVVIGGLMFSIPVLWVATLTTPFVLLIPIALWLYPHAKREAARRRSLEERSYFPGARYKDYWVYEERHGFRDEAIILRMENTEHGRWELWMPDESLWRSTVPGWAQDRRAEIAARIAENLDPQKFHQ
jgi:hypothetical protein